MLRSQHSKAARTGPFKTVLENISPRGLVPPGACRVRQLQQERRMRCFSVLCVTSSFKMLGCNIVHLQVGKNAKSCFPFICVIPSETCFYSVRCKGFFYSVLLLWPRGCHDSLSPTLSSLKRGPSGPRTAARFLSHERSTASLAFLMVWILYHLCMFANN